MLRSRFLSGAAAATGAAAVAAPAAAAQWEYKFGHDMPVQHPLHTTMVRMWREVEQRTGGRLRVAVFPQNQLGSDSAALSQIRSGALQFTCLSGAIIASVVPVTQIENLPFAFSSVDEVFHAMDNELGEYLRREMEAKDLIAMPRMYDLGLRQVTSSTHPIRTADDFANFKIRTPPSKIFVDAFKALGASPTSISFNETYVALQTHVVDGQETPYSVIETSRLYEVQKYLSVTNHSWAGWWLLANVDAWRSLPSDVQDVVREISVKYSAIERRETALANAALADKLSRRGMIFNKADTATFKARLTAFYADWKTAFGTTAWNSLQKVTGRLA